MVIIVIYLYIKQIFVNLKQMTRSKDITKDEQSEISLNSIVYDFSVHHSLIDKEDIPNIHEC